MANAPAASNFRHSLGLISLKHLNSVSGRLLLKQKIGRKQQLVSHQNSIPRNDGSSVSRHCFGMCHSGYHVLPATIKHEVARQGGCLKHSNTTMQPQVTFPAKAKNTCFNPYIIPVIWTPRSTLSEKKNILVETRYC